MAPQLPYPLIEKCQGRPTPDTVVVYQPAKPENAFANIVSSPNWNSSGTVFMNGTHRNGILQKALAEREAFLRRHPRHRAYQAEIDRILDKSGNINGRLASLSLLMQGKLLEMKNELMKLNRLLQDRVRP